MDMCGLVWTLGSKDMMLRTQSASGVCPAGGLQSLLGAWTAVTRSDISVIKHWQSCCNVRKAVPTTLDKNVIKCDQMWSDVIRCDQMWSNVISVLCQILDSACLQPLLLFSQDRLASEPGLRLLAHQESQGSNSSQCTIQAIYIYN